MLIACVPSTNPWGFSCYYRFGISQQGSPERCSFQFCPFFSNFFLFAVFFLFPFSSIFSCFCSFFSDFIRFSVFFCCFFFRFIFRKRHGETPFARPLLRNPDRSPFPPPHDQESSADWAAEPLDGLGKRPSAFLSP